MLDALGLTGDEEPRRLSGGEARRAALARVLAPDPDILLLDEPTNHLDLTTIEWLERELEGSRAAIVMISHDRRFLANLSRSTVWLDRGTTRRVERGFADFEDWRDQVLAEEETTQHKLDRKIVAEEHWLRYGVTARRKRNVKRLANLQALRETRRTHRGPTGSAEIAASEAAPSGALVIEAKGIGKSFGERPVVRDFTTRVLRGDRIGVVGPNGSGKTTLVTMLTGALLPDAGTVKLGATVQMATLDQHRDSLSPDDHRFRRADRRRQRHRGGGRAAAACDRLHEGFSVRARAGEDAAGQAFRRRARAADAGADAGEAVEPAGARRADQRPRSRNARRAGGHGRRICRHRAADQPRPGFSRPARRAA